MAKKRTERPDPDRRLRQAEKIARHLRLLKMILGPGRWDADSLARELDCSARTVHRTLQALTLAGIPWFFCRQTESYKVRDGFRFPGLKETSSDESSSTQSAVLTPAVVGRLKRLSANGKKLTSILRLVCDEAEELSRIISASI